MNKAQAEILANGFLASLGDNYQSVKEEDLPVIEAMLIAVGLDFNTQLKENLTKAKAISSGDLLEMSLPQVYPRGNGFVLEVGYPLNSKQQKYYDYVNKGVKGTKNNKSNAGTPYAFKSSKKSIPVSAVRGWLKTSQSKITSVKKYTKFGVETKALNGGKGIEWAIAKGIHKNGLRATHYFDKAVKVIFDRDFQEAMSVALKTDVTIQIRKAWQ